MVYVSTYAGKRHSKNEDAVLVGNIILTDTSAIFPILEELIKYNCNYSGPL